MEDFREKYIHYWNLNDFFIPLNLNLDFSKYSITVGNVSEFS